MENTLIHLFSLVKYPMYDLEAGLCVNIPSESGVKVLNMEQVEACFFKQT